MGEDKVKAPGTGRQIRGLVKQLPNLLTTYGSLVGPYQQSLINARGSTDPQQLALDESLYNYFGPRLSQIGTQIQGQQALGQAQNELNVLQGPGAQLVGAGQALNEMVDPEYYQTRAAGAAKLQDLLAGQDPNRLTGAELANVERGLNRTNYNNSLFGVPSATNTISNAMTFGRELDRKRNTLLNTINAIPQNLASFKSGTDAFQVATGRPSYGPNPAQGQFSTSRNGFGQDVSSIGNGLLGESGLNTRQNVDLIANRRDSLDRVNQTMSSLPSD